MNVTEFREHVTSSLGDEAIQRLLDAAAESIVLVSGPYLAAGAIDEIITPRSAGPLLRLSRPAESVTSIVEGDTTLAADDYDLGSSGTILRRLDDGTNPAGYWLNRVYITYLPYSDLALRELTQLELCRLEIAFNPTLVSQTIGSWSESYQQGKSYPEQRADILAALQPQPVGVW